jgi:hypothetical protein
MCPQVWQVFDDGNQPFDPQQLTTLRRLAAYIGDWRQRLAGRFFLSAMRRTFRGGQVRRAASAANLDEVGSRVDHYGR